MNHSEELARRALPGLPWGPDPLNRSEQETTLAQLPDEAGLLRLAVEPCKVNDQPREAVTVTFLADHFRTVSVGMCASSEPQAGPAEVEAAIENAAWRAHLLDQRARKLAKEVRR